MAEKEKLEKPLSCRHCPAVKISKKFISCPVNKSIKEASTKEQERILWATCPLGWRKK